MNSISRRIFPYWHTSGSGKRQALEFTAESCPGTHFLHHPCIRRRYVHPRRHPCTRRRYVHPRRHSCTRRRHVHPPASFLYTPPLRPPRRHSCTRRRYVHPGVIPAKAGILTRIPFYKGHNIVANYAAIPSRHISYGKGDGLCVLKSLVWIRAICKPKASIP